MMTVTHEIFLLSCLKLGCSFYADTTCQAFHHPWYEIIWKLFLYIIFSLFFGLSSLFIYLILQIGIEESYEILCRAFDHEAKAKLEVHIVHLNFPFKKLFSYNCMQPS